jgi:hypothetical protein
MLSFLMDVLSHHLMAALRRSRASKPGGRRQHTVHVMSISNMDLREQASIDRDQSRAVFRRVRLIYPGE